MGAYKVVWKHIITKPTESEQLLKLWQGALTIAVALKPPSRRNFEKNLSEPVVGPLVLAIDKFLEQLMKVLKLWHYLIFVP